MRSYTRKTNPGTIFESLSNENKKKVYEYMKKLNEDREYSKSDLEKQHYKALDDNTFEEAYKSKFDYNNLSKWYNIYDTPETIQSIQEHWGVGNMWTKGGVIQEGYPNELDAILEVKHEYYDMSVKVAKVSHYNKLFDDVSQLTVDTNGNECFTWGRFLDEFSLEKIYKAWLKVDVEDVNEDVGNLFESLTVENKRKVYEYMLESLINQLEEKVDNLIGNIDCEITTNGKQVIVNPKNKSNDQKVVQKLKNDPTLAVDYKDNTIYVTLK